MVLLRPDRHGPGRHLADQRHCHLLDKKVNRVIFGITIAPGSLQVIYLVMDLITGPIFIILCTKTSAGAIQTTYKYGMGLL